MASIAPFTSSGANIAVLGHHRPGYERILTSEALAFVAELVRRFAGRVDEVLEERKECKRSRARGSRLAFPTGTEEIRQTDWKVAPVPSALERRMVEITGPVDRKMIINALNSGADVFMADFEDSSCPTWSNVVEGQINLRDAVRGTIAFDDPRTGKVYRLAADTATLMVRPRGLHLRERHLTVDRRAVPASLFDFGLYFFHNVHALLENGMGPFFYLPKLESASEAELWNDVFLFAQNALGIPEGTIKATVLIETLPAAFQLDEILFELREHSAGLNCGRWDYIFSFIKTRREDSSAVLPDRSQVDMEQPCMRAYTQLVVQRCHRRGAHAIGGMAAQIPIKANLPANQLALEKVRADKLREVIDGHDGTWVAHPALVPVAREVFEAHMRGPNQLHRLREDLVVSAEDLLQVPSGSRTEDGLRTNVRVGIQYLEAWLRGQGCVPLYHLMEDAATAEISRAQVWQWIRHGAVLEDGRRVTRELLHDVIDEEMETIASEIGMHRIQHGRFPEACDLFGRLSSSRDLEDFLTVPAYELLWDGPADEPAVPLREVGNA